MQQLAFAPRRFTCEPAGRAGRAAGRAHSRGTRPRAVRPQRLRRHRDGPGLRPRRHGALQDDFVLGLVPRLRLRRPQPRAANGCSTASPIGPLLPGAEHVPPFGDYRNAWGVDQGSGDLMRPHHSLRARKGRRRVRRRRRADARRAHRRTARLLAPGSRSLRRVRRPADLRRDPHRPRQDRPHVRLRT